MTAIPHPRAVKNGVAGVSGCALGRWRSKQTTARHHYLLNERSRRRRRMPLTRRSAPPSPAQRERGRGERVRG